MKKSIVLFFVLLAGLISFSQDTSTAVKTDTVPTQPVQQPAAVAAPATTDASNATPERRFGIYAGYNMSGIRGDADSYESGLGSATVGLMFCFAKLGRMTTLWIEPGYSQMGSKLDSYQGSSGEVKLDYITIPLTLRLKPIMGLFGDIGLQANFLVNSKAEYGGTSIDIDDDINNFDYGANVGLGWEFFGRLGISGRYYMGWANINKDGDDKNQNSVFSIRAHLRF